MERYLDSPKAPLGDIKVAAPIAKGGTGASSAAAAAAALGAVTMSMLNAVNGVAQSGGDAKIAVGKLPKFVANGPTVDGPVNIYPSSVNVYDITNYDSTTTYNVTASVGIISVNGSVITYTAPASTGPLTITINERIITTSIKVLAPDAPTITSPVSESNAINASCLITTTAFAQDGNTGTHNATDWQVATDANFTSIAVQSINDSVNKTSWTATGLQANTNYYLRARYKNGSGNYGPYSGTVRIKTKVSFIAPVEKAKLIAGDKLTLDTMGYCVAIDSTGMRVAVGAHLSDPDNLASAGAVYIFVRTGSTWTQEAKLLASDRLTGDVFGRTIAFNSDATKIVIGAVNADPDTINNAGAAYIFTRTGTTWTQEAKLIAYDKQISDGYGWAVAMTAIGDRVAISARLSDPDEVNAAGAVYIYVRTVDNSVISWTLESKIFAEDKTANNQFGTSIAFSSDGIRVVVGAPVMIVQGSASVGAAYVFLRAGSNWVQEAKLLAADKAASEMFGTSVTMTRDGVRLAVGVPNATTDGLSQAGKVIVFKRTGITWTQEARLVASDRSAGAQFGTMVSMDGAGYRLMVSAPIPNSATSRFGAFYVFYRTDATWDQAYRVVTSDGLIDDTFAQNVQVSDDGAYIVAGSSLSDPGGIVDAGAAYVFG